MMLNRGQQLWVGVGVGVAGTVWEARSLGLACRGETAAQGTCRNAGSWACPMATGKWTLNVLI